MKVQTEDGERPKRLIGGYVNTTMWVCLYVHLQSQCSNQGSTRVDDKSMAEVTVFGREKAHTQLERSVLVYDPLI